MVKIMHLYSICTLLMMGHQAFGGSYSHERTAYNSRRGVSGDDSSSDRDFFEENKIFERTVYVDIDAGSADLAGLSLVSTSTLEHQFVRSFNTLSNELCDIEGLRVLAANIQYTDATQTEYIIRRGGNKYTIEFQVFATCDNCNPFSVTMFDHRILTTRRTREIKGDTGMETVFKRQLDSKKASKKSTKKSSISASTKGSKKSGKGKGGSKGSGKGGTSTAEDKVYEENGQVVCTAKHPEFRAPNEEEFRQVYSAAVKGLMSGSTTRRQLVRDFVVGGLLPINAITKVYETLDAKCFSAFEPFISIVQIEVSGDFNGLVSDQAQLQELAAAFFQNYNALQAHGCDKPLFREVTAVEIVMATPDNDGNGFFTLLLNAYATCQGVGCSSGISLFDNNMFRKLQANTTIEVNDPCECPVTPDRRNLAPSTVEMGILYDETVQALRRNGQVTSISSARIITEVGVQAITAAPSSMPTISNAPTVSSQPSSSFSPTGGPPTVSPAPSVDGSAAPTISAAPSVSKQPSQSPSVSHNPTLSGAPSSQPSVSQMPSLGATTSRSPTLGPSASLGPSVSPSTSFNPTLKPSISSSPSVSKQPSANPSLSLSPSSQPSIRPSGAASGSPSITPSKAPSRSPSSQPSVSKQPSSNPSSKPSRSDSPSRSMEPSAKPSRSSSPSLSKEPSSRPSRQPSMKPSVIPSRQPSANPSVSKQPSKMPSRNPSANPSAAAAATPADLDELDSEPGFDKSPDNDIVFEPPEEAESVELVSTDAPTMAPVEPVADDDEADGDDEAGAGDDDEADDDDSRRLQ